MFTTMIYHPGEADEYARELKALGHRDRLLVAHTEQEVAALLPEADVVFSWRLRPQLLAEYGARVRWLQTAGAGVDDLLAGPLPPGLIITRVLSHFGVPMAEYILAQLLAHGQNLRQAWALQAEQRWQPYPTHVWHGRRLGIAGLGEIGLVVAEKAKALGLEVWGLARTPGDRPHVDRVFVSSERIAFCRGVDALALILPLTAETRGMFGKAELAALPAHAFVINVGRGGLLDDAALLELLDQGHLSGAALDVFQVEPLPSDHPLWRHPRVSITPHVSAVSQPGFACQQFVENYQRFTTGQPLLGLVDRERGY